MARIEAEAEMHDVARRDPLGGSAAGAVFVIVDVAARRVLRLDEEVWQIPELDDLADVVAELAPVSIPIEHEAQQRRLPENVPFVVRVWLLQQQLRRMVDDR